MDWTWGACKKRSNLVERIEEPNTSDQELSRAFDFLDFTNRKLSGYRPLLRFIRKASKRWSAGATIKILDLSCGRGDLVSELVQWGRSKNWDFHILAVERYGRLIQIARDKHTELPEITFDVKEFSDPAFLQAQQFDYVFCHMALHRYDPHQIIPLLKTMNRLAKRGLFLCDWLRDIRAYYGARSLSKIWSDEVIQHDAPLSIRRGLTFDEAEAYRKDAGLDFAVLRKEWGYRYSISGERAYVTGKVLGAVRGMAT